VSRETRTNRGGTPPGTGRLLVALAALALALAGCGEVRDFLVPPPPDVAARWPELLNEVRAYERRIGFRDTRNFRAFSGEHAAFPFCGHVSRLYLPYSYEDAAIQWIDPVTEAECNEAARDVDVYYGEVEAWGESATPVTPSMVESKLDRFLYLVIHEDCHDQFDLPFGIEEPLCNVITYHAMAAFSAEKYGRYARASRAVRRYTGSQAAQTRATVKYYERLAALYARHARGEMSADALLKARADLYRAAEATLARQPGELNNIVIANEMTYSRHYPFLEAVFQGLDRDLAHTVAFFRHVDRVKPSRAVVMKRSGIREEASVDFVRAYEAAVVEATRSALADWRTGKGLKPMSRQAAR
jgi:hypothetical protein